MQLFFLVSKAFLFSVNSSIGVVFYCFGHLNKQTNSLLLKIFPRLLTPATYLHELCNCNFVCNFIVAIFSRFLWMERWNLLLEILCIVKMIYFLIFCAVHLSKYTKPTLLFRNTVKSGLAHALNFSMSKNLSSFLIFQIYFQRFIGTFSIYLYIYLCFKSLKIPNNGMDYP